MSHFSEMLSFCKYMPCCFFLNRWVNSDRFLHDPGRICSEVGHWVKSLCVFPEGKKCVTLHKWSSIGRFVSALFLQEVSLEGAQICPWGHVSVHHANNNYCRALIPKWPRTAKLTLTNFKYTHTPTHLCVRCWGIVVESSGFCGGVYEAKKGSHCQEKLLWLQVKPATLR